jgi:hypothetical protein
MNFSKFLHSSLFAASFIFGLVIGQAQDCSNHLFDQSSYSILNTTNDDFQFEFVGGENMSHVLNIGDLNGDGNEDIVVLASTYGEDITTGALFTCFLDEDNKIIEYYKINSHFGNLGYGLPEGARFGFVGDVIGDYNGDGVVDIVVSSYADDADGTYTGAIYILCLNECGQVKKSYKIGYENNEILPESVLSNNRAFGVAVSAMGDMDNDGVVDLAVGIQNYDTFFTNTYEGAVVILFMNVDGTVKNYKLISSDTQELDIELGYNFRFGGNLQNIGDLDGNGVNDLSVGAAQGDDICYKCGTNYILFLDSDGSVLKSHRLEELDEIVQINSITAKQHVVGDLNGNGVNELVVGSVFSNELSTEGGQMYMLYLNAEGKADSVVRMLTTYSPQEYSRTFTGPFKVNGQYMIGASKYKVEGIETGAIICFDACENSSSVQDIRNENNALILEPNPAHFGSKVNIVINDKNIRIVNFEVYDQLGKKIPFKIGRDRGSLTLELYDHSKNIYFVSCYLENGQLITKKLIIQ